MQLLDQMIVVLPELSFDGHYDEETQTWSVEMAAAMSPMKYHEEN